MYFSYNLDNFEIENITIWIYARFRICPNLEAPIQHKFFTPDGS